MRYQNFMLICLAVGLMAFLYTSCTVNGSQEKELQIERAVMAAPKEKRDSATVLGYTSEGEVDTLRVGTNELVCLADDPSDDKFSVACYHKSLEPFMRRGRELRRQGKSRKEVRKIRGKEVKSGKITIKKGASLYVLSGKIDESTGEITDKYLRYVVYMPFATSESIGLPTQPVSEGGPWLMDAGTHKAHIMINPPRSK